jgi:hypothetical protein
LEALLRRLFQASAHDTFQRSVGQRRWIFLQNGVQGLNRRVAMERALPAQHFVQHRAEAENIRAMVRRLATRLLRRHVSRRSERQARRSSDRARYTQRLK